MNLQAITVCDRYADFLSHTAPMNRRHFDRWIIVTSAEDYETQALCDYLDLEVVLTDQMQTRWGEFHKAKGINEGFAELDLNKGWCLHIDADVALPPRTRPLLDRADLDKRQIHGADRLAVPSYDAWMEHQALPAIQHDGYHVRLDAFEIMPRFNAWHLGGYAPVGYFQLWHPYTSGIRSYPADHHNGDKTDVLFAAQWNRPQRALLPELAVYHLESEPAMQGTNWGGRQTKRFGPQPDPQRIPTASRRNRHHRHHHHHPYGLTP